MKILVFENEAEALVALAAVDALARNFWAAQGRTVTADGLVSRNPVTDQDDLAAPKTTTWSTVRQSGVSFYFDSLTGVDPAWANWRTALADAGFTGSLGTEVDLQTH